MAMSASALFYMRPWLPVNGEAASEAEPSPRMSAAFANFADHLASVEGQGIARSYAAEATRPAKLTRLLEQIKTRFHLKNCLNPGKIVFPARPGPQSLACSRCARLHRPWRR